jgi:hypothetical protein
MEMAITNEMLYNFLKEFKGDFLVFKDDVNKRFERVDKRFEQVDRRFDEVVGLIKEERTERIKEDERIEKKLDKIYECRDRVAVKFTRTWMFASFFMAVLASMITLAFDKAF